MDFIDRYLEYTEQSEPQKIYHRWCALTAIGALLGRNYYIQQGHFKIYSNLYVMLLGEAGARKSTSIKLMKKLISAAGYENIAADKTTKEKFLLDLEGVDEDLVDGKAKKYDSVTADNLWGKNSATEPREVFIMADEFNEFAGVGNNEFYTTLGNLWDWDDEERPFTQRLKNSRSVSIFQPTISILGGNTAENFARAFPPDALATGFLSRMLLIYGEKSGRKFHIIPTPNKEMTDEIITSLRNIRGTMRGAATVDDDADAILREIYNDWGELEDMRFKGYNNRRYTQLLKLGLICSTTRMSARTHSGKQGNHSITASDIIRANTILTGAELLMPKALGEFGKSKHSVVINEIMDLLNTATHPLLMRDIWSRVHKDLDKPTDLAPILQGLVMADKIHIVKDRGYLPKAAKVKEHKFVDWSLLTPEERMDI